MTPIKAKDNPVYHESRAAIDGRAICVAETPGALLLRLKGTRQVLSIPWSVAYVKAAQIEADANRTRRIHTVKRGNLI